MCILDLLWIHVGSLGSGVNGLEIGVGGRWRLPLLLHATLALVKPDQILKLVQLFRILSFVEFRKVSLSFVKFR